MVKHTTLVSFYRCLKIVQLIIAYCYSDKNVLVLYIEAIIYSLIILSIHHQNYILGVKGFTEFKIF
uniref:Uncharacterized protein n=1 Tax=Triticum urartu TaxID=4572 RepID=A0A8R7UKP0_TRIUA